MCKTWLTSTLECINTRVSHGSIIGLIIVLLFINDVPLVTTHSLINVFAKGSIVYMFGNNVTTIQFNLRDDLTT